MRYPHLAEIYESLVEEHEELERELEEKKRDLNAVRVAFQTVFGLISIEQANKILDEFPEYKVLL